MFGKNFQLFHKKAGKSADQRSSNNGSVALNRKLNRSLHCFTAPKIRSSLPFSIRVFPPCNLASYRASAAKKERCVPPSRPTALTNRFHIGRLSKSENARSNHCDRLTLLNLGNKAVTLVRSGRPISQRHYRREKLASFSEFPPSRESRLSRLPRSGVQSATQSWHFSAETIARSPFGRALTSFAFYFGSCEPSGEIRIRFHSIHDRSGNLH